MAAAGTPHRLETDDSTLGVRVMVVLAILAPPFGRYRCRPRVGARSWRLPGRSRYDRREGATAPPIRQGYVYNRVMFNVLISRLGEAIVGELTLDQAFERMTQDITKQIAEKERGG